MSLKRCLFGNPENRKWHQNRPVEARSAPGPSKNGTRERFWKTCNCYRFIDLLLFRNMLKNQCKKGSQKLTCSTLLRTRGGQGSIVSAFFNVLVRCRKTMFFWSAKNRLEIFKNQTWSVQGRKKTLWVVVARDPRWLDGPRPRAQIKK
jgi:hypothetical protein